MKKSGEDHNSSGRNGARDSGRQFRQGPGKDVGKNKIVGRGGTDRRVLRMIGDPKPHERRGLVQFGIQAGGLDCDRIDIDRENSFVPEFDRRDPENAGAAAKIEDILAAGTARALRQRLQT